MPPKTLIKVFIFTSIKRQQQDLNLELSSLRSIFLPVNKPLKLVYVSFALIDYLNKK